MICLGSTRPHAKVRQALRGSQSADGGRSRRIRGRGSPGSLSRRRAHLLDRRRRAGAVPGRSGVGLRTPRVASTVMRRLAQVFGRRDRVYYELFEEAGQNILLAADLLDRLLSSYPDSRELAREILDCEHEGDRITHDIIDRVNHKIAGSIDREDILVLAPALDDVVDFTEEVADYLGLYKIEAPMDQAIRLAGVLHQASEQIANAIPRLRGFNDISDYTVEINRLENEGDRITREAVASLFDGGIDPMVVIRWKDLFERLEAAIDATERVANILEGIVIRNS